MVRGDGYNKRALVEVGQKVQCILYGRGDGYIIAVNGSQSPDTCRTIGGLLSTGGRARFDVVFNTCISRGIPECILRDVQWYIDDSGNLKSKSALMDLIVKAKTAELQSKQAAIAAEDSRNARRASLSAEYPDLTPADDKSRPWSLGAANLRRQLRAAFPGVQFSVKSKSYSGGSSINVSWTDGPTSADVRKVSNQYEEGSFDGTEDIYNYDHDNVWPDVFGGAKYVFENRSYSDALMVKAAEKCGYTITGIDRQSQCLPGLTHEQTNIVRREAEETRGE